MFIGLAAIHDWADTCRMLSNPLQAFWDYRSYGVLALHDLTEIVERTLNVARDRRAGASFGVGLTRLGAYIANP